MQRADVFSDQFSRVVTVSQRRLHRCVDEDMRNVSSPPRRNVDQLTHTDSARTSRRWRETAFLVQPTVTLEIR
jgi:hypothetical protein